MKLKTTQLRRAAVMLLSHALLFSPLVRAQSAAELLEKGIYTEETKGDLDAALLLYEQAIKDGQATESFVAQAMYRLGLLHLKRSESEKGMALLRELIEKHPGEPELVAAAKKKLPSAIDLLPVPWVDGEQLILHFKFPTGVKVGMMAYHANRGTYENRPVWVVGGRTFTGVNGVSRVFADIETFRPIYSEWQHARIGAATGAFGDRSVKVNNLTSGASVTVETTKQLFDNEQVVHMMRRLPLALGYKTTFDIITTLGGGTIMPISIEVTQEEELTVPAGTFKCHKVEMSVKQNFWYSADEHRYLVKMEAGGVTGELEEIKQSAPGQPTVYQDEKLGFSITAPGDWYFFNGGGGAEKDRTRLAILDPRASAHGILFAYPLQSLPPEHRSSLKTWAENQVKKGTEEAKDFLVRPDSWKDLTVAGYPAISLVADFTDAMEKKPKVHSAVFVFTGATAANFFFMTDPDNLEPFQQQFDAIVGSYIAK